MMDCSVRFVCEGRINSHGQFEQESGLKPALCVRGKKVALAVINDDLWVRTIELDLVSHDKASYVTYHGSPYEPKPFADRLLMSAKLAGKAMTRRSKHILTLLDKTIEEALPQELLEREVIEQERIYSDSTPKERQKTAQRASPPKNVTKEYEGKLIEPKSDYEKMASMIMQHDKPADQVINSVATEPRKAPKKIPRIEPKATAKKPAEAAKGSPAKATGPAAERGTLVKRLASEFKMTTFELRVMIRATGMRAPYEDEKRVRDAIKRGQKLIAGSKKK